MNNFFTKLGAAFLFFLAVTQAFAVEPNRQFGLDLNQYAWNPFGERIVLLVTRDGEVVWQTELEAAGEIRVEIFDPASGEIEISTALNDASQSGLVEVRVPGEYAGDDLVLVAEDAQGNQRLLDTLNVDTQSGYAELVAGAATGESTDIAASSTLSTILNNGDSANRIDILLLGDGYLQSEMAQWATDAEAAMTGFLSESPYNAYASYFNVHRMDAPSNESGVSHPENGVTKDTAFGSYYNCADIQRLICSDSSLVYAAVNALANSNQQDIIIVIVNDSEYGGSGGSFAVASTNVNAVELVLHETAHSFGALADEYDDPLPTTGSDCATTTLTTEPNVSALLALDDIKWRHWIDNAQIEIPTPDVDNTDTTPGLYAGAKYCNDLYRPTPGSKMRYLNRPFDAINEEALVLKIYDLLTAIESSTPSADTVMIDGATPQTFSVTTLQPVFHNLDINWYANDVWLASGSSLSSLMLASGAQTLKVEVTDPSNKVRRDSNSSLRASRSWQVTNALELSAAPTFSNNILSLPYVRLEQDQSLYQIELTVSSENPPQLTVSNAQQLNSALQPGQQAVFDSESKLTIELLSLDGVDYRIVLQHQAQLEGIVFQLESAEPL